MKNRFFKTKTQRNFSVAMVWINGGSSEDNEGKKGINKILSSLLGRGCKGFDNLEFSDYIDSHGAELNLETLEDGTLISLKSLDEYFYKLFPLLDLIINNPMLLESQFQNVKKNTIDSLCKEKENPFNITFEKWRKLVYFKHPYAYNPSGYVKDISTITYSDVLVEYNNFKNRNIYLISNNLKINNKNFELINKNNQKNKLKHLKKNRNDFVRYASTFKDSNQIILMIGNQTCSQSSHEYLPLKVLESHLSYGMSSVLFQLFREKNGLTYDVGVFNPIRQYNAPFLIYLSVSNKNAILAFEILLELLKNLVSSPISEKQLNLAKVKLKSSFLISNQSLDEILQRRLQLIGYDLNPDFDLDCLNKIEEIIPEDILKITNKYLSEPFMSIYGDKKKCSEIYQLWQKNF
ncbi:Insulinase family (Peptidase family M16) [Prochlorococcus marinus str. MIT 9515]|uniref:Insulinase family (Peptidase family M16) n=1 Tax=Prochlorococcus marinus (strain MIT 9515) TaxID=167542 RepID=A2BW85_PROM5|nr:pitrilysin family protein [Prochlorococcus marinus]ABM72046.1 Insulinase family (Peptidase family M16) [Prochlorococcus marinus str. MIT 9515]